MRTLQADALLLYSGSGVVDRDFLSLELVDGRPRYMFDTGDGPRTVVVNATPPLDDGHWHDVAVVRTNVLTTSGHALVVDGHVAYEQPLSQVGDTTHLYRSPSTTAEPGRRTTHLYRSP